MNSLSKFIFRIHYREGRSYRMLLLVTVFCIDINKYFVSFGISGSSNNPLQNTFETNKQIRKM